MNKTLLLAKMLMKNGNGKSGKLRKSKMGLSKNVIVTILMCLAFLPIVLAIGGLVSVIYESLAEINQEGVIIGFGLSIVSAVIFVFGIFYVINVFYFSQDTDHLLPLPLKPSQILSAKFIVTLIYEYLTELFLLMPILVTFGIKSGAGVAYYLYTVLIFITLPILPLVLASIIAMVVMRFSSIAKNKDRFRMIGGILAVFIGFGVNIFVQRYSRNHMDPEKIQEMLGQNNSLLNTITSIFPSVKLGTNALLHHGALSGLAYLGLSVGLSAFVILLFVWLGEKFYFKGVMGISESTAKRRKVTNEQLDKSTVRNSAFKSLFLKEIRTLLRTPIFFLNCVLMCFLWPLFLLIPFLTNMNGMSNLGSVGEMFNNENMGGIIMAVGFAACLVISAANSITSTSISREGTKLFVIQYLPVPYMKYIMAKVFTGVMFTMVSVVLILIMGIALFHIPLLSVLMLLLLSIPSVLFGNMVGMLIDLRSPKLNWDNEQKAVKQNMNAMLSILANLLVAGIIVACVLFLDIEIVATCIGLLVLFSILNFLLYQLLKTKGTKWLGKAGN
ncbi:putative ABC transporter permease subunit [Paenibacillus sp. KN14-4R]|uniref:putative ABC transporter permease subunit n=1 Tax=Paenibacillus sp. KN14-4R TaxID=3445773 RepID=UPI003FA0E308